MLLDVVRAPLSALSAELAAHAAIHVEEEGQEEVTIASEAPLVIDARLLIFADDTLLRAWWRHLGQRASVVQGVDHLDLVVLVVLVADLGAKNLVARKDDLGRVLLAV
jgi:hypothetical protein